MFAVCTGVGVLFPALVLVLPSQALCRNTRGVVRQRHNNFEPFYFCVFFFLEKNIVVPSRMAVARGLLARPRKFWEIICTTDCGSVYSTVVALKTF